MFMIMTIMMIMTTQINFKQIKKGKENLYE